MINASQLKENKLQLLLDFDGKRISNLSTSNYVSLKSEGFQEVKSSFGVKGIRIYLNIDGKEYSFLFDTGFNGSLLMPSTENYSFANEPHLSITGMLAQTLTETTSGLTNIYQQKSIGMGNAKILSSIVVTQSMNVQNAGIGFIRHFNWLIDYKEKKLFFKKNSDTTLPNLVDLRYKAGLIDSGMIVTSVNVNYKDYKVGDRILSVNEELVNDDNKCRLLNLLNTTPDWKQLKIVKGN